MPSLDTFFGTRGGGGYEGNFAPHTPEKKRNREGNEGQNQKRKTQNNFWTMFCLKVGSFADAEASVWPTYSLTLIAHNIPMMSHAHIINNPPSSVTRSFVRRNMTSLTGHQSLEEKLPYTQAVRRRSVGLSS